MRRYFTWDPIDGNFDLYETLEDAQDSCRKLLDAYRESALEGWDEPVDNVCCGVLTDYTDPVDFRLISVDRAE